MTNFGSMKHHLSNLAKFDNFYDDLSSGNLPDFSFIEPKFSGTPNDYHPADVDNMEGHSSIIDGEKLLANIYNAIRNSSNRADIAFFITFDECGGTFDHVPPPANATPPDSLSIHGQMNFSFNRLGFRVPTIMVSDYIQPNTVIQQQLQHTSFLRFVRSILKMNSSNLTARDGTAPDIPLNLLFTTNNRTEWPVAVPRNISTPEDTGNEDEDEFANFLDQLTTIMTQYLKQDLGCAVSNWIGGGLCTGAAATLILNPFVLFFGLFLGLFFIH